MVLIRFLIERSFLVKLRSLLKINEIFLRAYFPCYLCSIFLFSNMRDHFKLLQI